MSKMKELSKRIETLLSEDMAFRKVGARGTKEMGFSDLKNPQHKALVNTLQKHATKKTDYQHQHGFIKYNIGKHEFHHNPTMHTLSGPASSMKHLQSLHDQDHSE